MSKQSKSKQSKSKQSTISRQGNKLTFGMTITKEQGSSQEKDVQVTIDFTGESLHALQNRLCGASSPRVTIQNALRSAWKRHSQTPPDKYEAHISKLTQTTRELSIEDLINGLVEKGVPREAAEKLVQEHIQQ